MTRPRLRLFARIAALSLRAQLVASFATVLVLTATLGVIAYGALGRVHQASDVLATKWLPEIGQLASARAAMLEAREFEVRHARASDDGYRGEYEEKIAAAVKIVESRLAQVRAARDADADEAKHAAAMGKAWSDYLASNRRVVELGRAGKADDARDIGDGASKMTLDDAVGALDRFSAFAFERASAAGDNAALTHRRASVWVLGLVLGALAIGLCLALLITRNVRRQLGGEPREAVDLVRAVAGGDLTTPIRLAPGDRSSLMAGLRDMQSGLSRVVFAVRQGSQGVATASAEIAHGNSDLSSRTEQQASALQQTNASMQQLGTTVTHNADNARQADELARSASQVAQRGGEVVGQVVSTMRSINESSRQIADITGVIDSIAFQTNILALNAAVEAARAGDQGRGFAVVAAEVRSLAQRSAEAAKQIKSLISTSVERVEQGTKQVDTAGDTMRAVVDSIQRVTQIVNEISSASANQHQDVRQVGEAMAKMDAGTQQNSALVEQSAAAAESLRQQADQLVRAVEVFRLRPAAG